MEKIKSTKSFTGRSTFANSPLPREGGAATNCDRWAQEILQISAKRASGNAAPSVSIVD